MESLSVLYRGSFCFVAWDGYYFFNTSVHTVYCTRLCDCSSCWLVSIAHPVTNMGMLVMLHISILLNICNDWLPFVNELCRTPVLKMTLWNCSTGENICFKEEHFLFVWLFVYLFDCLFILSSINHYILPYVLPSKLSLNNTDWL